MQICTRCVLPDTFPGITFNEEGVCNHCQRYESFAATDEQKAEYRQRLMTLLHDKYGDAEVQALIAYSGGKDSSYTVKLFVEEYGARVQTFTFDNGFISPQAITNIRRVCKALGVEHRMIKYDQEFINTVYRHAAKTEGMYSMKTMERASAICSACSGFFKSAAMKTALDEGIPFIGYGWSPGQAPIQSALTQANPRFVSMAQAQAQKPIAEAACGQDVSQYFLQPEHYDIPPERWPWSVHPLAFEDYDEEDIKNSIRALGWVSPSDVDTNSTNCTMNAFANEVHIQRYGFHPYALEIANMVRQGTMSRDEGMVKIYTSQNPTLVNYALERIGLRVE